MRPNPHFFEFFFQYLIHDKRTMQHIEYVLSVLGNIIFGVEWIWIIEIDTAVYSQSIFKDRLWLDCWTDFYGLKSIRRGMLCFSSRQSKICSKSFIYRPPWSICVKLINSLSLVYSKRFEKRKLIQIVNKEIWTFGRGE